VLFEHAQDVDCVPLVDDQHPVEELAADRAHETLGDRVRARRPYRRLDDGYVGGVEDGIGRDVPAAHRA